MALCYICCRCGNFAEAFALLQQALEQNPAHVPSLAEQTLIEKSAAESGSPSAGQR